MCLKSKLSPDKPKRDFEKDANTSKKVNENPYFGKETNVKLDTEWKQCVVLCKKSDLHLMSKTMVFWLPKIVLTSFFMSV